MIPLKDDAPRFNTPYVNYFIIAANVVMFLFEVMLGPSSQNAFVFQFGFVPARITELLGGAQVPLAAAFLPVLTSMFLHASWFHLIGNMWALWIFGDNIEDYLGHGLYLLFYLLSGIAGSALHAFFNLGSTVPSVGASGAIAGVMGAYFLLYPAAKVLTLVPFLFIFFIRIPAWVFLGYWFVMEFLSGAATSIATTTTRSGGGIAVWAHVGGFVAGLLMIKLLPHRPRRYNYGGWN
jgi:membrane associated rhomboid family serine protease